MRGAAIRSRNRDNTHFHNLTQADVAGGGWPIRARSLSCITASFFELSQCAFHSILSPFKSIVLIVRASLDNYRGY